MKRDWSFPRQVLIALCAVAALAAYPLRQYGTGELTRAAIVGAVLSTCNVLLGYAAIEYSFGKSSTVFFKYVIGGMGLRMAGLLLALIVSIKVFRLDPAALVGSLGILYVVFLTLEILFIQKKINARNPD